ncbi:DASH complex subunit Dad3-domain-containing protein [Thamnocephalis sphaerospora]|uniref:DASH complex subunit DAD3 n=1 Tax=Thamnocephalis sphaerospora TaxID=78915 RepID=A0A4P9XPH0_9FUNG|nr:DASH complex subunit Dad3-domain-containing protein [Thamnocephalis sphaerospora]|eukprot:RKP07331.1 DASH complex subunit Dad3-domain-containing protein [Thamnocephalis sphaerospora]
MSSPAASPQNAAALRVEVLEGYENLAAALEQMNQVVLELNTSQVPVLTDKLREIERKFGLVYTLFKASVYSVVKDNEARDLEERQTNRPVF